MENPAITTLRYLSSGQAGWRLVRSDDDGTLVFDRYTGARRRLILTAKIQDIENTNY